MAKPISADVGLSGADFRGLNDRFYAADPADYFGRRHIALIVAAGHPGELDALFRSGTKIGEFAVPAAATPRSEPTEAEVRDRHRYVVAESQVLLHHVAESLMRIFFAHAGDPPCPWLELARVRRPGAFKAKLKHFLEEPARGRTKPIGRVFFGNSRPSAKTPTRTWVRGRRNIDRLLRYFAELLLSDAELYNAAKHGFAVQPGTHGMQLGDGSVIKVEGDAVENLELLRSDPNHDRWAVTTTWVEIDRSLLLVYLATTLLDALWRVARARYLSIPPGPIGLFDTWDPKVILGGREGIIVEKMHMTLIYTDLEEAEGTSG